MGRTPGPKRNLMRERIAHLAARLMAQDGVQDFGTAKRKAAEQLGAADTRHLPTNSEVEEALRAFRALYEPEEHAAVLRALREAALSVMRRLEAFNPHLTGSVLTGTAGKYSDINLQLFTDSVKDVEYFLMREKIPYRAGERRVAAGDGWRSVPVFSICAGQATVNIAVYGTKDLWSAGRPSSENGIPLRAKTAYVEMLLRDEEN
ncbi:MAG: hypothetical protein DI596_01715 [Azospira oryzae]|uniref:Nucleotidyltransferase domain protein n=1 Tax=Pelomicrobium methylotrophicum TaxID=2602750 RepID=A0A5C7EVD9_9PROT|nr:hypothetical protein [Pelomicrobium methylotrophicum]PZP64535.1 MAG: hypothetical protein DI596_01715 [Azospira oryzae]PZP82494.1 MAG: hypothetical protein DI593_01715 [Azospira oryzae]TXF11013.1 hypothetical protein FR698_12505 [Pelomicrobium methylotrophicum]